MKDRKIEKNHVSKWIIINNTSIPTYKPRYKALYSSINHVIRKNHDGQHRTNAYFGESIDSDLSAYFRIWSKWNGKFNNSIQHEWITIKSLCYDIDTAEMNKENFLLFFFCRINSPWLCDMHENWKPYNLLTHTDKIMYFSIDVKVRRWRVGTAVHWQNVQKH